MNINQYTGFVRWMFAILYDNIRYSHSKFRVMMKREFFLALLLWALFTGLFSIPVGIISMYLVPVEQAYLVRYIMTAYLTTSAGYFVYTGFSIMYKTYCDEQERIIQALAKNHQ